ncbi:hypothetical protein SAMN05720471_101241 [Fibrobacter sp. UWP2]|nr:hypothetical protein SAMN05720471_101241 [Fibrobacter sp. UWP2]
MESLAQSYLPSTGDKTTINIYRCDGATQEDTLQEQLLRHGLIKSKWTLDDDKPGTVFYWFRHVAARAYNITHFILSEEGHCGICYHSILNKFFYQNYLQEPVHLKDNIYI